MTNEDNDDELVLDGSKLVIRDAKGNNVNFSDRLNRAIQDAADYTTGVFLNIREYWEKVKAIAKEDGVNEADCQREFRYRLRGKLTKHQVYYLFHRKERLADMKARQQSELESRKFATFGYSEADEDDNDNWVKISDIKVLKRIRMDPMADIQSLVGSIARGGLINRIMVNKENVLIIGYRRLLACKMLRWEKIPVTVKDIKEPWKILTMELSENEDRLQFTPEEQKRMREVMEQLEAEEMGLIPRELTLGTHSKPSKAWKEWREEYSKMGSSAYGREWEAWEPDDEEDPFYANPDKDKNLIQRENARKKQEELTK